MRREDCHPAPLGTLRLSRAARVPCRLPSFVVAVAGSWLGGSPPGPRQGGGVSRLPRPATVARRPVALPRSRVTPRPPCPALRPRWCPRLLPVRAWDCCLPATGNRRLSPPDQLEGYPDVHNYTHFGAQSRSLHACSPQLRTPITGLARGGHYRPAGEALVGWDLSFCSHPLGHNNQFHEISLNPKVSGFPWRDQWLVRPWIWHCKTCPRPFTRPRLIGSPCQPGRGGPAESSARGPWPPSS